MNSAILQLIQQKECKATEEWWQQHGYLADDEAFWWQCKQAIERYRFTAPGQMFTATQAIQRVARRSRNTFGEAMVAWIAGNAALYNGELSAANHYFDRCWQKFHAIGRPLEAAQMAVGHVFALAEQGKSQEALALAGEIKPLLKAHDDKYRLAILWSNTGIAYDVQGAYPAALHAYDEAIALYQQLDILDEIGRNYSNQALTLQNMGRFRVAEEKYRAAGEIYRQTGNQVDLPRLLVNLAFLHLRQGAYGQALRELQEARPLAAELHEQALQADVDLYEAWVNLHLNLFAEATRLAQKASQFSRQKALHYAEALANYVWGEAAAGEGEYAIADKQFKYANAKLAELSLPRHQFRVQLAQARLALRQGQAARAHSLSSDLLRRSLLVDSPLLQAESWLLVAESARQLGRQEIAMNDFQQIERLAAKHGLLPLQTAAYFGIAQVAASKGKWQDALRHGQAAVAILSEMRRLIPSRTYRAAFLVDKLPYFELALRAAVTLGETGQALDTLRQIQSVALMDDLLQLQSETSPTHHWVDTWQHLQNLKAAWTWAYDGESPLLSFLQGPIAEGRQEKESLQTLEQEINRTWEQLQLLGGYAPVAVPTESSWGASLPQDMLTVAYFRVEDDLWAFPITAAGAATPQPLCRWAEVESLHQQWLSHLTQVQYFAPQARGNQRRFLLHSGQTLLRQLDAALLVPLMPLLRHKKRLFIVPFGSLNDLPWAALYDGEQYRLQQFDISYLPGLQVLRMPSRPPQQRTGKALVGAYSMDGRLPNVESEAAKIASLLPGATVLTEKETTVEAVLATATAADIVHLAAHAVFRPDSPLFSYIQLHRGKLTLHDLAATRLNRPLIVLSACATGRGRVRGGDLLSLGHAFLAAGAEAVITAQWGVHDPMAAQLMARFYSQPDLLADPAMALNAAMNEIVQDEPDLHPYFWAPFTLMQSSVPSSHP